MYALVPRGVVKQYSDVKKRLAVAPRGGGLRQKYVGAAGGRIVIPPYPAANELSGIYVTEFARGVDTREVKSRFDNSRPLVPTLRLTLESTAFFIRAQRTRADCALCKPA